VTEIDLRLVERRLRLDDFRFGAFHRCVCRSGRALCGFEVCLRDQFPAKELVRTCELEVGVGCLHFGAIEVGLEPGDCRPCLLDLRLKE
jgi:hypothetical protein